MPTYAFLKNRGLLRIQGTGEAPVQGREELRDQPQPARARQTVLADLFEIPPIPRIRTIGHPPVQQTPNQGSRGGDATLPLGNPQLPIGPMPQRPRMPGLTVIMGIQML